MAGVIPWAHGLSGPVGPWLAHTPNSQMGPYVRVFGWAHESNSFMGPWPGLIHGHIDPTRPLTHHPISPAGGHKHTSVHFTLHLIGPVYHSEILILSIQVALPIQC